jgi:hypothetical protein
MRSLLALVPSLLLVPAAFADCVPAVVMGGSGLSPVVSKDDQRALTSLLGQVDDVVCAFMKGSRFGFAPSKSGFFILTPDEVLFMRDRKTMDVLFRSKFAGIGRIGWNVLGFRSAPELDDPLSLELWIVGGDDFSFTLTCRGGAARLVNELVRRWTSVTGFRVASPPRLPPSPPCG